jgi:hypothetical protein
MALNWTMLDSNGLPVPLPDENVIIAVSAPGAEVSLTIPDTPPTAGDSGGMKKIKASGGLWLTNQRVSFIVPPHMRALIGSGSAAFHHTVHLCKCTVAQFNSAVTHCPTAFNPFNQV